jgi:hypothetical protein
LLEQNQHLRREDAQLWDWLAQTIAFPTAKLREFAITAAAMGLSLNQILVLLALILGKQACPGRSTVHRGITAAALAAGRVLKSLDARCRALVQVGCLDEICFHGRPVLVGIEPASMTWFLGQKASGTTGPRRSSSRRTQGRACKPGSPPCHNNGRRTGRRRWRTAWMCSTRPRRHAGCSA